MEAAPFSKSVRVAVGYSFEMLVLEGEPDPSLIDEQCHDGDTTYEESLLLICAQNDRDAIRAAEELSRENEVSYQNRYNQQVTWRFLKVVDCYEMPDDLVHGAELYSCLHTASKNEGADEFLRKWFNASLETESI